MSYFKHFPTTTYDKKVVLDITRKAKFDNIVKNGALDYMSYTVEEGERVEDVAYYYYDDAELAWLVLLSNDILDPYTQWPKSQDNLEKYIIAQYASASGTTGQGVIEWAKNATISSNIIHYQSQYDDEVRLNRASFVSLGNSHTITVDKIVEVTEYTINTTGSISNSDWLLITGGVTAGSGTTFTAARSGTGITFADTGTVTGTSISNPAREFYAVRAYDYEFQVNEERREIQLINKGYLSSIKDQLETILKDG
jgi:hypothetical protein